MLRRGIVILPALLAAGCGGCGTPQLGGPDAALVDGSAPDRPADAGHVSNDAAPDGPPPPWGTLPAWDPVWHETTPIQWPEIHHSDPLPDCGPRCTVLSQYPPAGFIPFAIDGNRLVFGTATMNGTDNYLILVDLTTKREYLIDDAKEEPKLANEPPCGSGIPVLAGNFVFYDTICRSHTRSIVRSLVTGESKTIALFGNNHEGGPYRSGLSGAGAYWWYIDTSGPRWVSRFDLSTGTTATTYKATECRTFMAGSNDRLLCTNVDVGKVLLVDPVADSVAALSKTAYEQDQGFLSPDGTEAVWLDYRDPGPDGQHGGCDWEYAGEIYYKNLTTNVEKRLTFDSPGHPVKKGWPSIRNGVIAWNDWHSEADQNPHGDSCDMLQFAQVRFMKGAEGVIQDLGMAVAYPEAVNAGIVGMWGKSMVLVAWP